MTPENLIAQAPQFYKTDGVRVYDVRVIPDVYGYHYLLKGNARDISASVHFTQSFESNDFGRYGATSILLSTMEKIEIGSIVEVQGQLFAISEQKPLNNVLNEYDFVCLSIFDYYSEFVIDTEAQANRILGANCSRYLLAMQFADMLDVGIPIFPSFFKPLEITRYLTFNVYSTKTRSVAYKDKDLNIAQNKQDFCEIKAVGLDTNDLQKVAYDLYYNAVDFSVAKFPSWEQVNHYDKAFDLKANIQKMDLMINYKIITTQTLEADQLLKKVFWDFKFN